MIRPIPCALAAVVALSTSSSTAQTTDAARYAVAYVEINAASLPQATKSFHAYRTAAAAETGFVGIDLFEQLGRAGHFVLVETWRDQAAFDAHQTAASLTTLKEALQPIRVSGYDQRPYKPLTVAPPKGAPGKNAVVVVSHVDIGGGPQMDVPAILKKLADASRAEPGNIRFDVTQHTARANHFTVVEVWADQPALDRHAAATHTKQYRDDVQPGTGSPLDERAYRRVE
jgi:quinol monooxygenase YgiN